MGRRYDTWKAYCSSCNRVMKHERVGKGVTANPWVCSDTRWRGNDLKGCKASKTYEDIARI